MRRRAAITDAELNRVLRVARKHGAASVDVKVDGAQFTIQFGDSGFNGDKLAPRLAKKPRSII